MKSTFYKGLIILALCMCISACVSYKEISGAQFNTKWDDSKTNSAESWWVVDEDDEFFYLEDRLAVDVHYYKVAKRDVGINIGESPKFPVNLKTDNVTILIP